MAITMSFKYLGSKSVLPCTPWSMALMIKHINCLNMHISMCYLCLGASCPKASHEFSVRVQVNHHNVHVWSKWSINCLHVCILDQCNSPVWFLPMSITHMMSLIWLSGVFCIPIFNNVEEPWVYRMTWCFNYTPLLFTQKFYWMFLHRESKSLTCKSHSLQCPTPRSLNWNSRLEGAAAIAWMFYWLVDVIYYKLLLCTYWH